MTRHPKSSDLSKAKCNRQGSFTSFAIASMPFMICGVYGSGCEGRKSIHIRKMPTAIYRCSSYQDKALEAIRIPPPHTHTHSQERKLATSLSVLAADGRDDWIEV